MSDAMIDERTGRQAEFLQRWLQHAPKPPPRGNNSYDAFISYRKTAVPPPSKVKEAITMGEYAALKTATAGSSLEFAVIVGWATGMRLSDVCLLKWDSIDMERLEISAVPIKTKRFGERVLIPFEPRSDLHLALSAKQQAPRQEGWPNDPSSGVYYADQRLALLYKRQQSNGAQGLQQMFRGAFKKAGVMGKKFPLFPRGVLQRVGQRQH